MKNIKKTIAIIVTLVLVVEAFSFAVFAFDDPQPKDDGDYYYVALGDSIAGGYGPNIDTDKWSKPTSVRDNYLDSDPRAYPNLVAKGLADYLCDEQIINSKDKLFWSNLGMAGFRVEDYWKILEEGEGFQASFFDLLTAIMKPEDENQYHFYDFYKAELEKADLITVQIGANNLLWGMRYKWFDIALGGKSLDECYKSFLGIPVFDIGKDGNPAIVIMLCYMIATMLSIQDKPVSEIIDKDLNISVGNALLLGQTLYYTLISDRKLTIKDIKEAVALLKSDKLEEVILSSTKGVEEDYNKALDAIGNLNPKAKLVLVNQYAPFGNSLSLDGVDRDFEYVINTMLNGVEKNFGINKRLLLNLNKFNFNTKKGSLLYNEFWGNITNIAKLAYQTSKNKNGRKLLLTRILLSSSAKKKAMLNTVIDTLTFPVLYEAVGKPTTTAIKELNRISAKIANERNLPIVDIYDGMPNEANIDPHPKEAGHKYIADQILATLTDKNKIDFTQTKSVA